MNNKVRRSVDAYLDAKRAVLLAGYAHEIDWQSQVVLDRATERGFLAEAAWVILSSGFRESIVRSRFGAVSVAFLDWRSATAIHRHAATCISDALAHFNNGPKIRAIAGVATCAAMAGGFESFWRDVRADPIPSLARLPFIGPTTSYHLAKNLGFDVVKPDRHMARVARLLRWGTTDALCSAVSAEVGDKRTVVDLVFWRFATLFPDYLARLGPNHREPCGIRTA